MTQKNNAAMLASLTLGLTYVFNDEIKKLISYSYQKLNKYLDDNLYVKLIINNETSPRLIYTINQELIHISSTSYYATDGSTKVKYHIPHKEYRIYHSKCKIYINITEEQIILYSFMGRIDVLQEYLEFIYKKHCAPSKQMMYYSINENKWNFPIFRKPRDYPTNDNIKSVLKEVDYFINNNEQKTLGLLLCGAPGTYKSTTIEIISHTYNMPIYLINLRSEMDDVDLINLVSLVPPKCIIAFEELEKQLESINTQNTLVTNAGILNAIDGLPRLNDGIIIIATANSIDKIDEDIKEPLLRKGRFENVFQF